MALAFVGCFLAFDGTMRKVYVAWGCHAVGLGFRVGP